VRWRGQRLGGDELESRHEERTGITTKPVVLRGGGGDGKSRG